MTRVRTFQVFLGPGNDFESDPLKNGRIWWECWWRPPDPREVEDGPDCTG
jgi:hypothetical protein